jgi:hypothetical protein
MPSFTPPSECIARVEYEEETSTAYVTFQKGGSYTLNNFPAIEYARWEDAASAGGYWNANVKGKY